MANSNDADKNITGGEMRTMAGDLAHVRAGEEIKPEKVDITDPNAAGGAPVQNTAAPQPPTNLPTEQAGPSGTNSASQADSLEELLPLDEEEAEGNDAVEPAPIPDISQAPTQAPELNQSPAMGQTPEDILNEPPAAPGGPGEAGPGAAPPSPPAGELPMEPAPQPETPSPTGDFMLSNQSPQGAQDAPPPPPPPERPNIKKFLILGLIVVVIAAAAGMAAYIMLTGEDAPADPAPITEERPDPVVSPEPPPALVTPDMVNRNLVAPSAQPAALQAMFNNFKNEFNNAGIPAETIVYLPVNLAGTEDFIDAPTLFSGLGINYPEGLFELAEPDLMLYAYSSGDEERIMCQNDRIADRDCYGVRLGIVLKAQDGKEEELAGIAGQWETIAAPGSGISSLILSNLVSIPSEGVVFAQEEYQSRVIPTAPVIGISYYNLPMPGYNNLQLSATAIDIATAEGYIVIATSKNSMLKMIDRILEDSTL